MSSPNKLTMFPLFLSLPLVPTLLTPSTSLSVFLYPLWAPNRVVVCHSDKTGIVLLLSSCMRPSLTNSKSGRHFSLCLPSPLPCSLVSFSNNKLLPASFGRVPELFLAAWWTPVTRLSPSFLFFFFFSLLWRKACCSSPSVSLSRSAAALPSFPDLEAETHVGFWFEV